LLVRRKTKGRWVVSFGGSVDNPLPTDKTLKRGGIRQCDCGAR
jgi:hypothetical protein